MIRYIVCTTEAMPCNCCIDLTDMKSYIDASEAVRQAISFTDASDPTLDTVNAYLGDMDKMGWCQAENQINGRSAYIKKLDIV